MAKDPLLVNAADVLPKAVGALVLNFALLEHWIDGMVACLFYHVDGARSLRSRYPFNAKDEVDFLEQCFLELPTVKHYRDRGLRLLEKLKPLAEMRHNVVHGHLRTINYETGTLEFSRVFKGPNNTPIRRILTIHTAELIAQGSDMHLLNPIAQDLCHRLVEEFGPEYDPQKPLSSP